MRHVILCLSLVLAACGGAGPTAPTQRFPQVAGSYFGTVTIVYPQLGRTLNCSASTTVNQNGAALSIAPMILGGVCGNLSLPLGDTTIDANGSLGNESGSVSEPSCGLYHYSGSGGFFGREFRFSAVYSSSTCVNFNITATLAR